MRVRVGLLRFRRFVMLGNTDQLLFQRREEAFRHGVVPVVTAAAHALTHGMTFEAPTFP
jgi:hypothetical protein